MTVFKTILLASAFLLIAACSHQPIPAPVVEGWQQPIAKQGLYTVKSGETIYSIAFLYGLDYHQIARANHLKPPYTLHAGASIKLVEDRNYTPSTPKPIARTVTHRQTARTSLSTPKKHYTIDSAWLWPAKGKILRSFSPNNKGINIGGIRGEPIYASQAGTIAYCGNGLKGYGNLIIIKHNPEFLSAYAHNSKIRVKEGQYVKAGQIIAEMGDTDSKRVLLHFEIRKKGIPVNPLDYLQRG